MNKSWINISWKSIQVIFQIFSDVDKRKFKAMVLVCLKAIRNVYIKKQFVKCIDRAFREL